MRKRRKIFKKRKILKAAIPALFLLCVIYSSAIYAYFTDYETTDNLCFVGSNEIKIEEEFEPPQPGKKTVKNPKAKNIGKVDCYVRGRIVLSDSRVQEYLTCFTEETEGMNESDWILDKDGWYYYKNILAEKEETSPIFTHIELKEGLPKEWMDVSIDVIFESVQSDGFKNQKEAFASLAEL